MGDSNFSDCAMQVYNKTDFHFHKEITLHFRLESVHVIKYPTFVFKNDNITVNNNQKELQTIKCVI